MRFAWVSRLSSLFSRRFAISLLIVISQIVLLQPVAAGTDPAVQAAPGDPQLILTKSIENGITTAQVGDVIRYRIRFECSSLTISCGVMEITDVLQPGLIYLPPPASSVPAGFTLTESPSGTITITKDDNDLLDGSQYDAVIAVRVDYDLRPLPAVINNQVNGRIDPPGPITWTNAAPSDAPPITIGTVGPYWAITKELASPLVNPTVNTDVTYRISYCPTTPPPGEGNVPMSNIVITDTLPAGATFVSASNGGTESAGVVTWPLVPGPVYPPNCVVRFVTIRYDSSNGFVVGNNVTNVADVESDYTPSTGTCTSPCFDTNNNIDHPIDPIAEIPNYNKDDDGDPIGITGTGRFLLDLDTLDTNFPSNELILVDNIPAELQVTSVSSGRWSVAFDYVHAYVEYSTNNGSSYTAFGPPVSFTDVSDPVLTYIAPVDNITNVRWRFEYDPDTTLPFNYTQMGLPYTWSFSLSPEIRVTPRATATVADPPSGASLPAAVAGTTYINCLQVSRTDSTGTPITDPCNNEPLTVQGTYVSLITSKSETPGTTWDDLDDPLINSFVADGSLLPGDTLRYRVTVEITERSSAPLINPTIQDTLPAAADFVFVRNGTARLDGTALPPAQQPTFSQSGQVLTWAWNNPSPSLTINPLSLGSHFLTVEFFAYIPRGQSPGTYTNNLLTTTDSFDMLCERNTQVNDDTDIDGDAEPVDPACEATDDYVVERSAALRGEKWIRSTDAENIQVVDFTTFLPDASCPVGGTSGLPSGGTNPFTRYPCISQAYPEGALSLGQYAPPPLNPDLDDFEYNLRIFNDGNVPMLSYVLYDILPYVGDTGSGGTLSSSPRLSEFRPVLTGPVTFLSGPAGLSSSDFTIEYNVTSNPCRPEVFNQPSGNVPSGCDNNWSTSWTGALSYRIRLNSGSYINPSSTSAEVRFGVPMHIPLDADPAGFDLNDARTHEIAWNSFSHVGSYDKDPDPVDVDIQDLLASEPRKVGITVPERMSVGNRVWRDADNSGTINPPDDSAPGIANVTVNLYRDTDDDGQPDGPAIDTTLTDLEGYYLFSNIPYDSVDDDNNRYIIGIPSSNFLTGQPLESLRSSTGTPAVVLYTNPPLNTTDNADDGIDPVSPGLEVLSAAFILEPAAEPQSETDLSNNDRDGLPGVRRGVNGERDDASDLTIDFGFFGGTDIPFSIGNHVWYDNGTGGGAINDGIRQALEPAAPGVLVRLYRDGDADGLPEAAEMIRTDLTDVNGFYLFDNLDPGRYYIEIPASNFASGQPLAGWYSSQPTGTETLGVNGGSTTTDIDNDDNGINNDFPETNGIFSGLVLLTRGIPEPLGETFISGEADPGAPLNQGYNPTGWDGPLSRGRFGETDMTSNLTIDFGFIPPMSLGNRVWLDEGAGTASFRDDYDNGLQDTGELGIDGVRVELWRDTNGTAGLQVNGGTPDTFMYFTTTDATGYYLFERLQPDTNYYVHIPDSNFTTGGILEDYLSSTDANQTTAPSDDTEDTDDNGIDSLTPTTTGITSSQITMAYDSEPLTPANETDINTSGTYGPLNVGTFGQQDDDSNLTIDFGFVHLPRSIGNRLWIDPNNNGQVDGGEAAVPTGVRVSLYLDRDVDDQPDDLGVIGDRTDDRIAYDDTDVNGYYLFDKLPPDFYIVGVDRTNFTSGGLLDGYNSSTGNVDNATNNTDDRDNGVDRVLHTDPVASPHGILSTSIDLTATPLNAPTGEVGSGDTSTSTGFNPTAGDGPNSRGRFGETDGNSDLTIDFGFFIPMSLGNRVFLDDGTGGGTTNNGIMDGGETPIANVRVELYHDADLNGVADAGLVAFDVTDSGGYYLFDGLPEGSYVVLIASGNFTASFDPDGAGPLPTATGALLGRSSSTPTGTENSGVAGNPYTPNTDRDDNGINAGTPATTGILSGTITLAYGTEPTNETELSGQADPGAPANLAYGPTGWDGPTPGSRGRWGESDANSNLTIDFGFIPVFSLGNRVFFDTNNNSARNGGEGGINNVRVQLFASDGTTQINVGPDGILNTSDDAAGGMLTAGGGYYRFNNLPAGDYIVVIPSTNFATGGTLRGYWSSGTSMDSAGVISETTAALANADADSNVDENGTLSSGRVISSIVTLGPTTVSEPTGETELSGGQGQPDGQANMTVDFGFYRVELGNLVYLDNNANGNYDGAGDTVISGRTVQLFAANGTTEINVGPDGILGTTDDAAGGMSTNASGIYLFSGLPQGQYIVRTSSGTGTASTIDTFNVAGDNANPNINADNNDNGIGVNTGTVSSGVVTLTPGSTGALGNNTVTNSTGTTRNPTVDFGFVGLVAIGNHVWFDDGAGGGTANNGILDGTESGVSNVTVELYTSTGTLIATTSTNGSGLYQFDQLYPGTYYTFIPAAEFQAGGDLETYYSSFGNGANETSDENADENGIDDAAPAVNGIRSTDYTLLGGTEPTADDDTGYTGSLADANVNFTADFGFTQKYSLGNRVWFDTNNSSTQQIGTEVGVDGVVVNLYRASDLTTVLATDTTANGGYYLFDDLYPGDYVVAVAASNFGSVLNGYWSSGTSRTATGAITESAAATANSDTDLDDNGTLQTAGALNGAVISSTVTLGPSGDTEPTLDTDLEAVIGDGNQPNGRANMTVDFGFYKTEIGNLVFSDVDNSGHYNTGDVLLQNITVELYAGNGTTLLTSTTTDVNGEYRFDGQPDGDYVVKVVAPSALTTSTIDTYDSADNANPDVNTDNNDNGIGESSGTIPAGALTMAAGESAANISINNATGATTDLTVDFGFVPLYSLGNRVWFDTNNNSLMDAGEVGVDGVTVRLYRADGSGNPTGAVLATDTTSGGGFYLFDDLYPRDYVVVIPQSNFASGGALAGYWSSATTLTAGGATTETAAPDADTDTDVDDNGTLDVSGGAFDGAVLSSAVTLGGPLGGTEPINEAASQLESGVLGSQGNQPDDYANMTVDFGFYQVQLSNQIFTDFNKNGIYDAGDVPHVGATVQLFASNGTTEINVGPDGIWGTADDAAGGVTTAAAGTYLFAGLPQGAYIVKVTPLAGYTSTVDTAFPADVTNPDTNIDSNDNGIGEATGQASSNTITLTPGSTGLAGNNTVDNATGTTSNPTMDFGFYVPVYSLGNRVWFDTDNDSVIDTGTEVGVDNVDVELYAADGSGNPTGLVLATQTTASGGYYRFDGLFAGDYVVVIPASQFGAGAPLEGYWSSNTTISAAGVISETAAPDPDNDIDSDDNGTLSSGRVISRAITLGPGITEPTTETDIASPNPAGEGPNDQSNLTVDLGFYRVELSNQVFIDVNKNGTYDAGDGVLPGATIQLFTGDGTTEINVGPDGILGTTDDAAGGMITDAGGAYLFSGLPQGDYTVRMTPPSASYTSTIDTFDSVDSAGPNQNTDNNDNGVGLAAGQVSSNTVTLTAGSTGTAGNNTVTQSTGTTSNPTIDFGVMPLYSLGNRVWFDTNNNSAIDSTTEVGVDGVDVILYAADGSGNPTGAALATQTTASGGYYRFDALVSGDYVVVIPSSEFGAGGTLRGYWSSGTTLSAAGALTEAASPDPDNDTDSEDNGSLQGSGTFAGAVISQAITLGPGITEPTSESDIPSPNPAGEAPNNQSNLTVDFGFYRVELSNQIFVDIVQDGLYTGSDLVLPGATVQLFASNGTTEINVGPDGILGTSDDAAGGITTAAGGTYLFSGLPQGTYVVGVTPPVGYSSAIDSGAPVDTSTPNTNTDNNDNGVGVAAGQVFSNTVVLTPGDAATNNVVVNASGTTTNPTIDFGFTAGFAKTLISTDAVHTADPEVTIGEIIHYEISMLFPVGTINNVTVVDTPQSGLAFVDCIDITLPANVTSSMVTSGACDANDGTTSGSSNPLVENSGARVTFDLGTVTNSTASAQLVTIEYSLIVLDIADNQNGDSLTNSAVWSWTGGSKSTSASPVEIVEPELTIDKNATPTSASYGSVITFTIDVAHDLVNSTADSFDVIVTDQIPAGLTFITGSETSSGTAALTSFNYDVGTNTITFVWDVFRLNETASVSFQATFDGPAPVVNSASVEWTSLLIDPQLPGPPPVPVQLSPYNPSATERWYDPSAPAGVNNYAVTDSATLTEFRPSGLPRTGFAPGVVTELPAMPADFAYAKTDVWLEIPQLKLQLDIVGVPFSTGNKDWDLKWLGSNAGWLDGTAFPTYDGNSALTAHSTLSNGKSGPFANLGLLKYGDQIIIHLGGQKYIYEIRENKTVLPSAVNSVLKHEEFSWLTLITCKTYNETTKEYSQRTVVRAVLIKVVDE